MKLNTAKKNYKLTVMKKLHKQIMTNLLRTLYFTFLLFLFYLFTLCLNSSFLFVSGYSMPGVCKFYFTFPLSRTDVHSCVQLLVVFASFFEITLGPNGRCFGR